MVISFYCKPAFKKVFGVFIFSCCTLILDAQISKADSLRELLVKEKTDSNRARFLWQLAFQVNINNPDTAINLSQQSLLLAKKINYEEGQSRALGVLSNSFRKIGNYPRALDLNIQKLQLEEKRKIPRNLASVLMNIAVIYVMQEEYEKALDYYEQSDSVITLYKIEDLRYFIKLNLGDVYNRLNKSDSAYLYFNTSLLIAQNLKDEKFIGSSMAGLGHSFLKLGNLDSSLFNYRTAIAFLKSANDDENLTEAALGLANLYKQLKQYDSSKFYATLSYSTSKKDGFLSKELEAAEFLSEHFKTTKIIDSAFAYIYIVKRLNDSINSRNRIRESQIISSNEQFRQFEIAENNKLAIIERNQRLQLLFIGIFIPGLFLITLFLSRVKVNIKIIRVLGVLSLMFFFEYITVLLHPVIANATNHTPWAEILLFVIIGAVLVPLHHRLEHWLIQKLLSHRATVNAVVINKKENIPGTEVKLTATAAIEIKKSPEINEMIQPGSNILIIQNDEGIADTEIENLPVDNSLPK